MPKPLHITLLIIAALLGAGAAALDIEKRKATLIIVAGYCVIYGAFYLVRRYRETHNA